MGKRRKEDDCAESPYMSNPRRILGLLTASALMVVLAAQVAGAQRGTPLTRIDRAENCNELTPESVQITASSNVNLEVLVLLDEVSRASAEPIFNVAAEAFEPLRITLVVTFKKATFDPAMKRAEELVEAARTSSGGSRPAGIDIVYVLTAKDVSIATGNAVGYADCIGGIRYPNRAFAVGEAIVKTANTAGLNFYVDGPAKVAAHEIGHLLGARHEHANCAQGIGTDDINRREATVCTLMTPYLDFQSNDFGTLESAIARSYAERYAAP